MRLVEVAARLEGLQRSFEGIQDFVRAYSPALWQREYSKFVQCAPDPPLLDTALFLDSLPCPYGRNVWPILAMIDIYRSSRPDTHWQSFPTID